MIVIADTTPLNYLVLIDQANLLPRLYGRVLIPPAVYKELQAEGAPASVPVQPTWPVNLAYLQKCNP